MMARQQQFRYFAFPQLEGQIFPQPSAFIPAFHLFQLISSVIFLVVATFTSLALADDWVRVAAGGLGNPARIQVDGMAVYGDQIYVASGEVTPAGIKQPHIFRAPIRDDTFWAEFSPPWGEAGEADEVTDMIVFQDRLYVSNSGGQIWRTTGIGWTDVTPDWPGNLAVLSMAPMLPRAGGHRLCVVRASRIVMGAHVGVDIWCGTPESGWDQISVPPEFDSDPTIQDAILRRFGRDLYLGVGGGSAGSRMCEVWKLSTPARFTPSVDWSPVTTDCFGFGDDLTWVSSMAELDFMLYMGTAGHGANAVIYRTNGRDLEDVTPCQPRGPYDCSNPFAPTVPVRYGSMAVGGARLYAGTRTGNAFPRGADVVVTENGEVWERSNLPGFGESNDATTALAGKDAYLYAGTLGTASIGGFQVWRRTPELLELIPFMFRDFREMVKLKAGFEGCLIPLYHQCYFYLGPISLLLGSIDLGFDRAKLDDPELIQDAKKMMSQAESELEEAEQLAALADKEEFVGTSQQLRAQALTHVQEAIKITHSALLHVKIALQPGGE
jgi:hypothetical protein